MRNSESIIRVVLVVLVGYGLALGATFNGIVTPEFSRITLGAVALLVGGWLLVRWRRGWVWHSTPLDKFFLVWMVAFAVSILANQDTWRRSSIGLWYMGLYIGVWYVLNDLLANRAAKRETLIDAMLFGSLIVLLFGGLQIFGSLGQGGGLPRVVSTFGNPNFLGAFLVVLIPLTLGRLASVRNRAGQIVLGIYATVSLVLLLLTGSRGAWLGLGAALAVWGGLVLAQHDLLTPAKLRAWWSRQATRIKTLILVVVVIAGIGAAGAGGLLLRSLSEPGRDVGLRTYLYDAALMLFTEKPLTGYGLFTYGHYLGRFSSIPPQTPHAHAHNALLHIAAELGIFGLIALAVTVVVSLLTMRRNWRDLSGHERALFGGAVAAVSGFAVHHQLDVPAMMPAIALMGMLALGLALSPAAPKPLTANWRKIGHPAGITALWLVLIASGAWSESIYSRYLPVLRAGVGSENYRAAAEQLQSIIDADPDMALYRAQQAYLLSLAADETDVNSLQLAVDAWEQVVALEPYYAPYRANFAVMNAAAGEYTPAMTAMREAAALAPDAWQFYYNAGVIAEQAEDHELFAIEMYKQTLAVHPDAYLHPIWGDWPLQTLTIEQEIAPVPSPLMQAVLHLEANNTDTALEAWEQFDNMLYLAPAREVVRVMIALAQNDRETAVEWLRRAAEAAVLLEQTAWQHLGLAKLAQFDGDSALAAQELAAARVLMDGDSLDEDIRSGQSFAYGQFLRQGIPRQLLPQVIYPVASPLLAYLLENF